MVRILPLVGVIGLMLYTFFDVLSTDRGRFTSLSKNMWLLVALIPVIGGLLWIFVGKPRRSGSQGSVISLNRRPRPVAPDDDPEFLRRLDEQAWRAKRDSARSAEPPAPKDSSPPPSQAPSGAESEDSEANEPPQPSADAAEEEGPTQPPTGER